MKEKKLKLNKAFVLNKSSRRPAARIINVVTFPATLQTDRFYVVKHRKDCLNEDI